MATGRDYHKEEKKEKEMTESDLQLKVYITLLECIAAYFECDIDEVKNMDGNWEWADWDGENHSEPMQEMIKVLIAEKKVWAWIEDKYIVHLWYAKEADRQEIVRVLAHEIGHSHRPFHRDRFKEEQKAQKYGEVASLAFDMMNNLNCGVGNER